MPNRFEKSGRLPLAAAAVTVAALGAKAAGDDFQPQHQQRLKTEVVPSLEHYETAAYHYLLGHHRKKHRLSRTQWLAHWATRHVSPELRAEWDKVNNCEESGNWHVAGSEFSGGLGISNDNWRHYGGTRFSPTGAGATPDEQIIVAMNIVDQTHSSIPDQNGCQPGGW